MPVQVLFSRYRDGSVPVFRHVNGQGQTDKWEVAGRQGYATYATDKALLTALTGRSGWTAARYFKLDATSAVGPSLTVEPSLTIEDMFAVTVDAEADQVVYDSPLTRPLATGRFRPDTRLTVAADEPPLGIDLATRGHEVRKLMLAGFGRKIHRYRCDPDDALQEVYRGLLARNKGTCPWDVRKSSFGHYVHMVCGCVLSNYFRKVRRDREFIQVGMGLYKDGQWRSADAAEAGDAHVPARQTFFEEQAGIDEAQRALALWIQTRADEVGASGRDVELAMKLMPHMRAGSRRAESMAALGASRAALSRAITFLRQMAREWAASQGLPATLA